LRVKPDQNSRIELLDLSLEFLMIYKLNF